MVTVNDNSVIQDRNGSKTKLRDGLESDEREGKIRAQTLQKRGEAERRSGEEGFGRKGVVNRERGGKKGGERSAELLRGEGETREGVEEK